MPEDARPLDAAIIAATDKVGAHRPVWAPVIGAATTILRRFNLMMSPAVVECAGTISSQDSAHGTSRVPRERSQLGARTPTVLS
jgi:hypothetical protein